MHLTYEYVFVTPHTNQFKGMTFTPTGVNSWGYHLERVIRIEGSVREHCPDRGYVINTCCEGELILKVFLNNTIKSC